MSGSDTGPGVDDDTAFVLADDQISSRLEGEEAVLDLDSGTYYGLNEVGTWIRGLLEEPQTVAEIREAVVAEFDTTPQECDPDVRQFLQELRAAGLVENVDE